MSGGGGVMPSATHIETAPSPFHYFDPTRVTKRTPSAGKHTVLFVASVSYGVTTCVLGTNLCCTNFSKFFQTKI